MSSQSSFFQSTSVKQLAHLSGTIVLQTRPRPQVLLQPRPRPRSPTAGLVLLQVLLARVQATHATLQEFAAFHRMRHAPAMTFV